MTAEAVWTPCGAGNIVTSAGRFHQSVTWLRIWSEDEGVQRVDGKCCVTKAVFLHKDPAGKPQSLKIRVCCLNTVLKWLLSRLSTLMTHKKYSRTKNIETCSLFAPDVLLMLQLFSDSTKHLPSDVVEPLLWCPLIGIWTEILYHDSFKLAADTFCFSFPTWSIFLNQLC